MIITLTKEENKHYDRHLILEEIGKSGQLKLKQAKVLVIGAGGLGCPVLQYLAAAGVGTLGIIDDDVVTQSNLQRQILYTIDDIGCSKAKIAAKRLSRLNPFIAFNVYNEKLTRENALSLFRCYDIIVDGSDNFSTRYLTNDAAVLAKKPLVYGAIFKFEGQLSVFNYQDSATYRCLYPSPPKPEDAPNCSQIGVLGVLPGIIGSLQANETIKIICGIGTVLTNKLLIYNVLTMHQIVLNFEKDFRNNVVDIEQDYDFFCGVAIKKDVSFEELSIHKEKYNLLDVREDWERDEFNIGGQHIPIAELLLRVHEVYTDKVVVVYCKTGVRSARAIDILIQNNFPTTLLNLKGGCFQ